MKHAQNLMKTTAYAAVLAAALTLSVSASAQSNPYQHGPAPTQASLQVDGPFPVSTQRLAGRGFGNGTIYSPNATGKYAVIAVVPGFTAGESSMQAMGRRMATHGFVVVTISTNTVLDFPPSRATQLLAALRAATAVTTGPVAGKMDTSRQAVAGWSMGGGGTLLAASDTPSLKGATAWAPWVANSNKLSSDRVPTTILGGTADTVANPTTMSTAFYNKIPASVKKYLGIIQGADHGFSTTASQPASYISIAWMKRNVDNDTRYSQFLNGDSRLATFKSTGPF